MSTQNKKITGRFLKEVVNKGNLAVIDELVADDYVYHGPYGTELQGKEALKEMFIGLRQGFPDLHVKPNFLLGDGNMIGVQFSLSGTHTGEFAGMPATHKTLHIQGMVMSRIKAGLIREDWEMYDAALMMMQLGMDA